MPRKALTSSRDSTGGSGPREVGIRVLKRYEFSIFPNWEFVALSPFHFARSLLLSRSKHRWVSVGRMGRTTVKFDPKKGTVTATVEELATYSMLLAEALFEALAEKGIVSEQDIKERVAALRETTKLNLRRPN